MSHPGIEPGTTWLKVKCSTDWASDPHVARAGIDLNQFLWPSHNWQMPRAGIEPATRGFSVLCSTDWAIWAYGSGNRIWTYDLRVMSPTSYLAAPSRVIRYMEGEGFEPSKLSQQIYSLPPLATRESLHMIQNFHFVKPTIGLEPITCWLQVSCSANWATSAYSFYIYDI